MMSYLLEEATFEPQDDIVVIFGHSHESLQKIIFWEKYFYNRNARRNSTNFAIKCLAPF